MTPTLFDLARSCVVCGAHGTAQAKRLGGLPAGVVACDECRAAVGRREVGIVVKAGAVHVVDGRTGQWSENTERRKA